MDQQTATAPVKLPRVAITYCTQCRWMLRAGYFGQELLSTFGTSIGEIALLPATGGIFTVHLTYRPKDATGGEVKEVLLWDRKAERGFPETKILKQRVRNHIEPDKNLGHSDTPASKAQGNGQGKAPTLQQNQEAAAPIEDKDGQATAAESSSKGDCEDCG